MKDTPHFYTTSGPLADPGRYGYLLDDLPGDIGSLVRVVQGLIIHIFWADQYGVQLDETRRDEVRLRRISWQLERIVELDSRPLAEAREPARRLVGNCRDYSVMLTSFLHHRGIPARARCGFGRYFLPNHYEDHWVAEYWNAAENRWVLVDAQLDDLQQRKLGIDFNPLDTPRDRFITGGLAWTLCRAGKADPNQFGIHDMHGMWFIRSNLGRDVAALNKMELLPWDEWGLVNENDDGLTAEDMIALDEMAALTSGDVPAFDKVRSLYEVDERWRVPTTIRTYDQQDEPQTVQLFDDVRNP